MIAGMHAVIYTRDAEADRAFLRDVLGFPWIDAGEGWLIFAAPPAELACHPAEHNGKQELFLMADDVQSEIAHLSRHGIKCDAVSDEGWGLLSAIHLPGGGRMGLYQPRRHPIPQQARRRQIARRDLFIASDATRDSNTHDSGAIV